MVNRATTLQFPSAEVLALLETMVKISSPSGFTESILSAITERLSELKVEIRKTNKGAIIAHIPGENRTQARLLTAHVDTLGAMVKSIKADGRLQLTKIGGFNWNSVEGEYCTIHTRKGDTFTGTILLHETSVHVYSKSGEIPRDDQHIEVRLDVESHTKAETQALGIGPGDFVSFDPRFHYTPNGFIKSRHLDDKASVALLLALIKQLQDAPRLPYSLYFYFSNNEEIGFGGNSAVPSEVVEYLAVDMGAIGDGQTTDEYSVSICAKDSSGPYHYQLTNQLIELANKAQIPYQVDIYPFYGSDASAAMRAGLDLRHALIGPGIESSHALERTHQKSLEATYQLLYRYCYAPMI